MNELVLALLIATQPGTSEIVPPPATAWIERQAIPFTTSEAGNGFDDLARLKDVVGDARIVSLGEATHGTREAFQMKHRMLEYLCTNMGFSIFSIEASMPESFRLNEYVLDGKGDPATLIGGMYFWTWNTEEVLAMVKWMREFNLSGKGRVQFTGFDMQTPDVASRIATEFIAASAPDLLDEAKETFGDVKEAFKSMGSSGGDAFGVGTSSFPVEAARGKKLVLSGWIRTERVNNGWAGFWWRCDGADGNVLAFDNMNKSGPKGMSDWQRYEVTLDIPAETVNINWGVLMPGTGAAWFDDIEITLDGKPYTDPARFSLDFEDDGVRFMSIGGQPNYAGKRVQEKPHGGTTCLELRHVAEGKKVDKKQALAKADALVAKLKERRDALAAATTPKDADWAIQNARVVAQGAKMVAGGAGGSNIRDESMADNVAWILEQNPGAKIVLWAHNAHVSRGTMWGSRWMGSHLTKKFPGQMVVFGFATAKGRYTAIADGKGLSQDNVLGLPTNGSVEAYLQSTGMPRLILDLRGASADDPGSAWTMDLRPMRSIGAMAMETQFTPCVVRDLFDAIVYQEETTAARQLKSARAKAGEEPKGNGEVKP
ncbi:MAG: erythromycin esterase family protein [Phycisphaerales bacterium]